MINETKFRSPTDAIENRYDYDKRMEYEKEEYWKERKSGHKYTIASIDFKEEIFFNDKNSPFIIPTKSTTDDEESENISHNDECSFFCNKPNDKRHSSQKLNNELHEQYFSLEVSLGLSSVQRGEFCSGDGNGGAF